MSTQMLVLYVCVHECLVVFNSLQLYGPQPARLLCPRDSPGKNTGVGCCALLQGSFPTQGSNPRLMSPALAGRFFTVMPPAKPLFLYPECNIHAHVFFGMPKPFLNIKA